MSATRPRPGPLGDLPLELFAQPNFATVLDPGKGVIPAGSLKRPRDDPAFFIPAKRRILHQEGIFMPSRPRKSPVQYIDQPQPAIDPVLVPARQLDFGLPMPDPNKARDTDEHATPKGKARAPPPALAPSPELNVLRTAASVPGFILDPPGTPRPNYASHMSALPALAPIPSLMAAAKTTVPQQYSDHYPGFIIYNDPTPLASTSTVDEDVVMSTAETDEQLARELDKENAPVRMCIKKAFPAPAAAYAHKADLAARPGAPSPWLFSPPPLTRDTGLEVADPDVRMFGTFVPGKPDALLAAYGGV